MILLLVVTSVDSDKRLQLSVHLIGVFINLLCPLRHNAAAGVGTGREHRAGDGGCGDVVDGPSQSTLTSGHVASASVQ